MQQLPRLLLTFLTVIGATQAVSQPAVPIDPLDGVLEAFAKSDIVALGEGPHRNEQAHAIRIELIRDPRFAGVLNDIVVEFGSARYQDVMDRFITGEDVAYSDLRRTWEDTSAVGDVWDRPIYEEFFRTVRAVNEFLPEHQRYRVLLGDPGVDWARVLEGDAAIIDSAVERNELIADMIKREVLDNGRNALVFYANVHLLRLPRVGLPVARAPEIIQILTDTTNAEVFSIYTEYTDTMFGLQPDIDDWTFPAMALIQNTALGLTDFSYHHSGTVGSPHQRMQDQFDAVLFLGSRADTTFSARNPERCSEPGYIEMRRARLAIRGLRADSLLVFCESLK